MGALGTELTSYSKNESQAKPVKEWGSVVTAYTIDFSPITKLTDEQFDLLCEANPEIKFERTPTGELVIMPPTGGETGRGNAKLTSRFVVWSERYGLGEVFDSSTCFRIPSGGDRSPDVAWVEKSRWDALTPEQQRKFPPICPDFVLELLSPSDNLTATQRKMQEYLTSGIRLGWLINPEDKQVEIYRPGQEVEVLQSPSSVSGEEVLLEFSLNLEWIWR
ncbi:conserved domain protein (plasmid) [Acaryochloris marina MBIC11017]|uniref:Conserved domain protein n=1 Tax=Acaryochloris marina (strain MBIC 11017) TaxID=329726 RepID=A8ZMA0_ACAM1|nr:conserved domain protein [Acaryochloris marina MBIC11017]